MLCYLVSKSLWCIQVSSPVTMRLINKFQSNCMSFRFSPDALHQQFLTFCSSIWGPSCTKTVLIPRPSTVGGTLTPFCITIWGYGWAAKNVKILIYKGPSQWQIQRRAHPAHPLFSQSQPVYCSKVCNYITALDETYRSKNPLCWTTTQ